MRRFRKKKKNIGGKLLANKEKCVESEILIAVLVCWHEKDFTTCNSHSFSGCQFHRAQFQFFCIMKYIVELY